MTEHTHNPDAAKVVLVRCGDYRCNRARDVAKIDEAVDRIAARLSFVVPGAETNYDLVVGPGPAKACAQLSGSHEKQAIIDWCLFYISKRQHELIIVSAHYDCGREGDDGRNRALLMAHLTETTNFVAREINLRLKEAGSSKPVTVAGLMFEIEAGHVVSFDDFTLDELNKIQSE